MIPSISGYAFTTHKMPVFMKRLAKEYIKKYYETTIFPFGNNLIDIRTLNNLTNLDCMNCHLAHNKLCCEGPPYPPLPNETGKITKHYKQILNSTLDSEEYLRKAELIKTNNGLLDDEGTFISECGKCIFFNKIEGSESFGCSIHSYALKSNIPYLNLKTSSCLMYPLDVLTLDNGGYFIFGIDEETVVNIYSESINHNIVYGVNDGNKGFSRWNQNDLKYLCVNPGLRNIIQGFEEGGDSLYKSNIPSNIYKIDHYKPLFEVEKKLLIKLFGIDSYKFIKDKTTELNSVGNNLKQKSV